MWVDYGGPLSTLLNIVLIASTLLNVMASLLYST